MKLVALIILIATNLLATAQDTEIKEGVTDLTKISFFPPGVAYEKRVTKLQTLSLQLFLSVSVLTQTGSNSPQGASTKIYFDPALAAQYRVYYNYQKRRDKGANTQLNSMNYIAPLFQLLYTRQPQGNLLFQPDKRRILNEAGFLWGMQRNFPRRFSLDLNIGPSVLFGNTTLRDINNLPYKKFQATFSLYSQFHLGIWLNKRGKSQERYSDVNARLFK